VARACAAGKERSAYTGRCVKSCPPGTARNAKNRCTKRQAAGQPMAVRARRPSIAAQAAAAVAGQDPQEVQNVAAATGETPAVAAEVLADVDQHADAVEITAARFGMSPEELRQKVAAFAIAEDIAVDPNQFDDIISALEEEAYAAGQVPGYTGAGLRRRRARRY
jgi:hypothetical protein